MIGAVLAIKVLIDGAAALILSLDDQWSLALMFFGFAVADVGAFWVALK